MAKKGASSPRHQTKKPPQHSKHTEAVSRNYSLEDILNEYRTLPPENPEGSPVSLPSSAEGSQKAREADAEALAASMRSSFLERERKLPEAEKAPVRTEEELAAAKKAKHVAEKRPNSAVRPRKPAEEQVAVKSPEDSPLEEKPENFNLKRKVYQPGGSNSNPFRRFYGWFLGQAAVLAIKKQQKAAERKEDEHIEAELSPLESAKIYASQLPAFFRRSRSATLFSLLSVWIALAWGADIPIPGALGENVAVASQVSMILLLTVMLMGLDVITVGILSAVGGKPRWETLLSVACICSVLDCVCLVAGKNSTSPLPPCAACCVGITLALRGNWYRCRSLKSSFLALHKNNKPFTVNGVKLPSRDDKFILKHHRDVSGFIHRSEENDCCEAVGEKLAPIVLLALPLLSLFAAVVGPGVSAFPHILAILSVVSCCWDALISLPMLIAPVAERLARNGSGISGWKGIEELGDCRHLLVGDSDLFPEGTTAFNSIRILAEQDTEQVISRAGSIVVATGSELSRLFSDLLERSGGHTLPVLGLTSQNGGSHGIVDGVDVHVGNAGYMYLLGVRIDPKLVGDTVIYISFGKELVGAFGVEYNADEKIRGALLSQLKRGGKPVFAPKDFNIDAQLVERLFHCKTDSFEFPLAEDRQSLLEEIPEITAPPAAFVKNGGLDSLTDLSGICRYLSVCGNLLRILCCVSSALGLLLGFVFCIKAAWGVLSATRLLLYLLFWLLPGLAMSANPRL